MSEPTPERSLLGLERLSAEEIAVLGRFVLTEGTESTQGQYRGELEEFLDARSQGPAATAERIKKLASSENHEAIQRTACEALSVLAEQNPDIGFPLWSSLAGSENPIVHSAAKDALVVALGILDLDPAGVIRVISAYNKRRSSTGAEAGT